MLKRVNGSVAPQGRSPGKIIFTCRDEILKADYRQWFMSPNSAHGFSEYRLLPFNEAQKENYLSHYIKSFSAEWDMDTYKTRLASIPELNNLISNPFLLNITVKVLPEILIKYTTQNNEAHRIELTRHEIYQTFIDQLFERHKEKLLKKEQEIKSLLENSAYVKKLINNHGTTEIKLLFPPSIIIETEQGDKGLSYVKLMSLFTERLARAMFKYKTTEIHCQLKNNSHLTFNWQGGLLKASLDAGLEILLNAGPFLPIGRQKYQFIHPSVLYFFAAKHLFNGALLKSWVYGERNLNVSGLLDQPAVLKMLTERVHSKPEFTEALWEIINNSRSEPTVWRAAANAITILNRAGLSFSGMDLRQIRIGGIDETKKSWGADLSRSVMDGADFSGADLRYVNFTNAWFSNALFDGASMDGLVFGEQPWRDFQLSPDNKKLYLSEDCYTSPDGRWFAIYVHPGVQLYQVTETAVILGQRISCIYGKILLSNQWLAVASSRPNLLHLYDLTSGKLVDTTSHEKFLETIKKDRVPNDQYQNIFFSKDGNYLGLITEKDQFSIFLNGIPEKDKENDNYIFIWTINELGKLTPAIFLPCILRLVSHAVFSPNTQYVFEVSCLHEVGVWDISNKTLPRKICEWRKDSEYIKTIFHWTGVKIVYCTSSPGVDDDDIYNMGLNEIFKLNKYFPDWFTKIFFDASGKKFALLHYKTIYIYEWDKNDLSFLFSFSSKNGGKDKTS